MSLIDEAKAFHLEGCENLDLTGHSVSALFEKMDEVIAAADAGGFEATSTTAAGVKSKVEELITTLGTASEQIGKIGTMLDGLSSQG